MVDLSPSILRSPAFRVLLASLAIAWCTHPATAQKQGTEELFARGLTWIQFLGEVKSQRELWRTTTDEVSVAAEAVERFRRFSRGLRLLVVAEDWCPDSVNVLPHVAGLAAAAFVPLRIVDRSAGAALMSRHRTPDGRIATPTIVLLRESREAAAWVERPAVVQEWFLSMATSAGSAERFGARQAWYDADRGQTVVSELTRLAEQSAPGK